MALSKGHFLEIPAQNSGLNSHFSLPFQFYRSGFPVFTRKFGEFQTTPALCRHLPRVLQMPELFPPRSVFFPDPSVRIKAMNHLGMQNNLIARMENSTEYPWKNKFTREWCENSRVLLHFKYTLDNFETFLWQSFGKILLFLQQNPFSGKGEGIL